MPIYEYNCPKCGIFELTQRITENALKKCPTCKSKVERLLSRTSFVLKGSGWYATDYAKSKGDSGNKSDSTASDSTKSEPAKGDGTASSSSSKPESPPSSQTSSSGTSTSSSTSGTAASK